MSNSFSSKHAQLFEALYFLKMGELKHLCEKLDLPYTAKKGEVIEGIKHFITTGKILETPPIPAVSKASAYAKASADKKKGTSYPLKPETLMLIGAYKNDAQTRAFFKKLIGNHFHFTAFGIDWLNARWKAGKPPTYQEFATMWQREVDTRKDKKPQPKQEWALITFVQKYMERHPNASKTEVTNAWHKKRAEMVNLVKEYFRTKDA